MADKKVNLIISMKDGVSSGLQKIRSGVSATGEAFKKMSIVAMGAATAIIGGFTALAKAYAGQETANNRLAATFTAAGENGEAAAIKFSAFATAIQRTTTLGDEEVMSLISLAKTMGIANSKLEESTKGAIGLSKAFGIDLNSSMKMVALANNGQYEMLGRYIPELRTATTEAEKHAIVQRAMARGFKVAEAELDTVAGAFTALKGVIGDAMEVAGESFFGNGGLSSKLKSLKETIIDFTESGELTFWANEIKTSFAALAEFLKPVFSGIASGAKKITETIRETGAWWGSLAGSLSSGVNVKVAMVDANLAAKNANLEFEARKKNSMELFKIEREQQLANAEAVSARQKQLSGSGESSVKQTQGGFADLYKKMYASGKSNFEQEQFTRFVASQETQGVKAGVSGAGKYAAEQRASGLSEYDVIQRVQEFIKAEVKGIAAGVQGVGAFAQGLIEQGKSSYDIGQSVTGLLGAEKLGSSLSGGLSDPLAKTNELLTQQNTILQERLGGVIE